ncbi:uncharacterized protein LOC129320374 [Prosopis cineraria]|uniref:uncharacterized protein LOC129320374 n=1 Tax=Prosopis cineraria TaxID=364024 RepID=UPI00240F6EB7|nr:uncharacterized protein LOC129320374 [Prosopis cineraria]
MVALFHNMMHKEIEVYVDDMVAKSVENESHVGVLRKLFMRLHEYQLRLNPNECIFGALSGKLLGFIMSCKGIEVDPNKVRAIQEMPSPQIEKEVRSFLGRLNYIARFIANLTATCRVLKWQVVLSEYDIKLVMQKSVKGSAIVDHLADNPLKDDQPLDFQFLDEGICTIEEGYDEGNDKEKEWEMYFDGATNMHGNGVGAVIVSPEGKQFLVAIKLEFDCTNNIVEYEACVNGLRAAITLGIQCLKVFGDSTLIIHQVIGEWRIKDVKLFPYQELLTDLIKQFKVVSFHHLTRDKNCFIDALATLTDIKDYITKRSYLTGMTENEKKTLHHLAMTFFISKDVLYKRGYDGTLLRCVSSKEAKKIMVEVHEGICGTHANGHTMAKQI